MLSDLGFLEDTCCAITGGHGNPFFTCCHASSEFAAVMFCHCVCSHVHHRQCKGFCEHGIYGHAKFVNEEAMHIPFTLVAAAVEVLSRARLNISSMYECSSSVPPLSISPESFVLKSVRLLKARARQCAPGPKV